MSYEPTTWVNGDIITATKLNNIESGVQSVSSSYEPTTWVNGDIITATKLNNIEQGIANAGGGGGSSDFLSLTVTVVNNSNSEIEEGDIFDGFYNLYYINSSGYIFQSGELGSLVESVLPNTTKTIIFGYSASSGSVEIINNSMFTYGDLNNIDANYDEYFNEFEVTDNTENSSMTITIS